MCVCVCVCVCMLYYLYVHDVHFFYENENIAMVSIYVKEVSAEIVIILWRKIIKLHFTLWIFIFLSGSVFNIV